MLCEAQRCGRYPVLLDVGVGAVIKSPATAPLGSFQLCPRTGYKSIGGGRDGGYERRGYSTRGATANGGGRGAGSTVPSRVQANSIPRSISVSRGDETATVVLILAASRALDRPGERRFACQPGKVPTPTCGNILGVWGACALSGTERGAGLAELGCHGVQEGTTRTAVEV